jgi:hypothetical protein
MSAAISQLFGPELSSCAAAATGRLQSRQWIAGISGIALIPTVATRYQWLWMLPFSAVTNGAERTI